MTGYAKILTLTGILLTTFVSCEKEHPRKDSTGAVLVLDAGIENSSVSAETKGAYTDTAFKTNQTIGLSICVHETGIPTQFEPHLLGYGNLRATKTSDVSKPWTFYNSVLKTNLSSLYLTSREDGALADVYAYAPYNGAADLQNISVDFSKNVDYMWATQNGVGNKGLDPTVNDSIPVTLQFRHLLCLIRFGFKPKYSGSDHLINHITLKRTCAKSTPIYSSGTLNAMTGTFSQVNVAADSVRINYGANSGENNCMFSDAANYRYVDFLIYPTDYMADDDLTVIFSIDGFRYEYPVKRSDILHSDGVTYGFKKGYSYNFQFQLDNYIHLKNITIQSEWTPGDLEDQM